MDQQWVKICEMPLLGLGNFLFLGAVAPLGLAMSLSLKTLLKYEL